MKNLVFWFDNPPRVSKGIFNEVSKLWLGKSYYIAINDTREERKKINWDDGKYGEAELIILNNIENKEEYINKFVNDHKDDIHIFNGYKSKNSLYINKIYNINKNANIIVWLERPSMHRANTVLKKLVLDIMHRIQYIKYRKKVKGLLPLGEKAIETYKRYGWNNNIILPFMYLPPETTNHVRTIKNFNNNEIKFVYVGRFSGDTKGVDVLLEAFDRVKHTNWKLDMVGGYGELTNHVKLWTDSRKNGEFKGSWDINEVTQNLSYYDVCIVPSRYDGWNVTVNEAIKAGVGVITTDEAGSDELIINSGAGKVVKAGSVDELTNAITEIIDNPDIIEQWNKLAKKYYKNISPEAGAKYFIEILEYLFNDSRRIEKPTAPWLCNKYV